jgi:RHS repeat-associated protein
VYYDKPFGETRYAWEGTPTTYRFTGQREDATIQLLFYNARYYDGALGRFIQADTIVPNPASPQDLNRYSYAANNPLRFSDPSGHWYYDPGCQCLVQTRDSGHNYWIDPVSTRHHSGSRFLNYNETWESNPARPRQPGTGGTSFVDAGVFVEAAGLVAMVASDSIDAVATGVRCLQGNCNAWDVASIFLPIAGSKWDDALGALGFARKADDKGDNILKRAFRDEQDKYLKQGEEGLSVHIGASDEQILSHLEGEVRAVPRSSVGELDLTVVKTPGNIPELEPYHYEIRPGPGMTRKQFKGRIREIPWE